MLDPESRIDLLDITNHPFLKGNALPVTSPQYGQDNIERHMAVGKAMNDVMLSRLKIYIVDKLEQLHVGLTRKHILGKTSNVL